MNDLGNTETPPPRPGAGSRPPTRADGSRRLTVLSAEEQYALYGRPDFDEFQRAEYFAFSSLIASPLSMTFLLVVVAFARSWFSTRSAYAAATSGPKHRRCNVHNGLAWNARGPTASFAASLHPRPGGQLALAPAGRASGSHYVFIKR